MFTCVDSDKLMVELKQLDEHLANGVVLVSFTKKDGTRRDMRCTKNMSLIPEAQHPKQKALFNEDGTPVPQKERNPQLFNVFDVDINEWRSFKYATVIAMRLD